MNSKKFISKDTYQIINELILNEYLPFGKKQLVNQIETKNDLSISNFSGKYNTNCFYRYLFYKNIIVNACYIDID